MTGGNFTFRRPAIILLSGLPGAGKTTFARALARHLAFEHVESDSIRRRLAPLPTYTSAESASVFAKAEAMVRAALEEGRHALLDATNLTQRDRARFVRLARSRDAQIVAVRLTAPEVTIRERLHSPREGFSQAGVDVYERMRGRGEPFAMPAVVIDTRFPLAPGIDLVLRLIHDEEQ
ncbi:MAG: ATP-binding protein [Anaerolineaceae bacterium]